MFVRPSHAPTALRRLVAAGCAVVVLALAVFAASPDLHARLHAADPGQTDDCAVVLFGSGVATPAPAVTVVPPPPVTAASAQARPTEFVRVAPRYLRLPERGPPAVV